MISGASEPVRRPALAVVRILKRARHASRNHSRRRRNRHRRRVLVLPKLSPAARCGTRGRMRIVHGLGFSRRMSRRVSATRRGRSAVHRSDDQKLFRRARHAGCNLRMSRGTAGRSGRRRHCSAGRHLARRHRTDNRKHDDRPMNRSGAQPGAAPHKPAATCSGFVFPARSALSNSASRKASSIACSALSRGSHSVW
jgi:hypothetical protein